MKIGYIIARVSGWYWGAYQSTSSPIEWQSERYDVYDSEEEAISQLPKALKKLNYEHLTIHKIYYDPNKGRNEQI